jgi:antitoxin component YwqK of YwqJK toxin-antitoxin module
MGILKLMTKLKTEVTFVEKNGRTLSKRNSYFENGQIAEEGMFGNSHNNWSWNVPVGLIKKYYENGQHESEVSYNDYGAREGESVFYSKAGKLLKKTLHQNDNLIDEQNFIEEEKV